ncbi:hypothetical protein E1301_Tti006538 [Triplophysa tibetana]|uniref:Uncharacterized protein n=1 Tax=Triplophysa tibetana TaxID=1572043 RepID=A0A5A9PE02_9TELE|nr:hypothetical protein E1301_Tti006538 [Triplophysa tibetana]
MQNAVDQITMATTVASFADFVNIQPITSWGDLVGETEYDQSEVVIPSWADMDLAVMDAEVPYPSARVQRRVEKPAESSDWRVNSQKSDCSVWRKQASSSSDFKERSSQASEARNQSRSDNNGFPQEERMGGAKFSSRAPTTAKPPSQDWRRLPPQDFVRITARPVRDASLPQHRGPATSSSENGVGPLQNTTPAKTVAQKQEMGGKNKTIKPPITTTPPSQDWRRLPPQDFVRRMERPVQDASLPQHQGPATSSSENGVGPLQNTTPAKSVAQKQEMGGQNKTLKPPITPTPAPEPEHKSLPSRLIKKSLTEAGPRRPKAYPPGFFKRIEPIDDSPPQNTSLPSDFNQKLRAALKNTPLLHPKAYPPGFFKRLQPIEDSPPQHQNISSSSATVIGVSTQEGQKNTAEKSLPQRQGVRSSLRTVCSLEDLCKMLDGLHLSENPTLSLTPDSPRALLRPASFIYKTQPKFAFLQHHKAGQEIWKNPPAPPTPAYTSEHLPAPHLIPQPSFLDDKNLYLIRKLRQLSCDG